MTGTLWQDTQNTQMGLHLRAALVFHTCSSVVLSVLGHIGLLMKERAVFYKQRDARFFRTSTYWLASNCFQVLIWGFLESGLFCAPAYWMTGLQKDGSLFMMFWFGCYLLNVASTFVYKIVAIICPTLNIAQTLAGLLQVLGMELSGAPSWA